MLNEGINPGNMLLFSQKPASMVVLQCLLLKESNGHYDMKKETQKESFFQIAHTRPLTRLPSISPQGAPAWLHTTRNISENYVFS